MSEDLETAKLDDLTLAGGWKLLCLSLMGHAVARAVEDRNVFRRARIANAYMSKGMAKSKVQAQSESSRWLEGGVGAIPFEEVCEMLGVRPEFAREKIEDYAHARRREKPVNVPW